MEVNTLEVSSHSGISLKNILFATDFSEASEAALPYAAAISRRYESQLHIVHAMSPLGYIVPSEPAGEVTIEALHQAGLQDARERMQSIASRLKNIPHHTYVREGELWDTLSDIIRAQEIELLVVGTHARTGVEKLVLGSKAEEILRQAPCPVLIVGPNIAGRAKMSAIKGADANLPPVEISLQQIVYATDFTPESLDAARFATSLAQEFQSKVTLLHALGKHTGPDRRLQVEMALQKLEKLVPEEARLWCLPRTVVQFGAPPECILQEAQDSGADLIVLGVRAVDRHLGAATHLPWAIAHKVIAHAHCPVLTIPFKAALPAREEEDRFYEFGGMIP